MKLDKIAYTAHAKVVGGRTGTAESSDGALKVKLNTPKELGGAGGSGTNPEQLFAAGYAACFIGALGVAGRELKVKIPADVAIDASVSIGPISNGFGIQAALKISLPGIERSQAEALVAAAHRVCPSSNATRGNVDVELSVA